MKDISLIHDSLVNGQRRQMSEQIDEYGLNDFWADYRVYLGDLYAGMPAQNNYFVDACISYHRIQAR